MPVEQKPQRINSITNYGIMANMSAVNLGRLFADLIDPDRMMSPVDKQVAEHCMTEISGGAKQQNNPNYKHKGDGKPSLKKQHEHSGTQPSKSKKRYQKKSARKGISMIRGALG